jgi:hypothetical protein
MATTLSFLVFTAAVLLGAIFAFVLLQYAFGRLSGKAASSIRLGSRIGVLALLLPSVWFAVFLGAPLGGGFAIGVLGEPAMQVGAAFGFGASVFCGSVLGGIAGGMFGAVMHFIRCSYAAT